MKLKVTDDSGFLALVDPDAYSGYVARDWKIDRLRQVFQDQMAARHLLIWGTGQEGCWTVEVVIGEEQHAHGSREVSGTIISSYGRLLLANYESLTMAAQFADFPLPETHELDLLFSVSPGAYECRIVQHPLRAHDWQDGPSPGFTLELRAARQHLPPWGRIPWTD